jgi:hypothetical protein
VKEHWAPGHVALGSFDSMTFGVPLGFYSLEAGTGHGVHTLTQGQYEQATRELAPAALLVGLHAGGKGVRSFSGAKVVAGVGAEGMRRPVPEPRVQMMREGGGAAAGAGEGERLGAVMAVGSGQARGGRHGGHPR